jgi:hypothetical protein
VYVKVIWCALLALCVLIEVAGRTRPARVSTLRRTGAMIATRVPGRVVLILLWVFVGVHLFSRYTIPRH